MNVKRKDLIKQLIDKYAYTKSAATQLVDDFSNVVIDNLENGNSISIHNFGCFDILMRKARRYKDMRTGATVDIPEHYIPRFYPGNRMRLSVKMWEDNKKRGIK